MCLLMPYRKRRIQLYIVELTCDASLSVTISVHMALYSANTRQRFQNLIAELVVVLQQWLRQKC